MDEQVDTTTPAEREPLSVVVQIPVSERKRKAWWILGVTAVACLVVWAYQYSQDQLAAYWWSVWPVLVAVLAAFVARYNATKTVTTEAGKTAQLRKRAEAERRESEFFNKWWVRYPLAVVIIWGAGWIWSGKPSTWWLALIALLFTLWLAREVVGLLLVAGGVYLLIRGVAALPVSVAVIIGAVIIASAVGKK